MSPGLAVFLLMMLSFALGVCAGVILGRLFK